MAINIKIILRINKTLPNGEHPIMFRITEDRRNFEVSVKKSSLLKDWDARSQTVYSSHPNHKPINALLNNIKVKTTLYFASLQDDQSPRVSAIKDIVERLTGAVRKAPSKKLLEFFDDEIERLKAFHPKELPHGPLRTEQ